MKEKRTVKYVKSFSRGQITVPKEFREILGLGDEFWLKLSEEAGKIIAEPVETARPGAEYAKTLRSISGDWFDERDSTAIRKSITKRLEDRE